MRPPLLGRLGKHRKIKQHLQIQQNQIETHEQNIVKCNNINRKSIKYSEVIGNAMGPPGASWNIWGLPGGLLKLPGASWKLPGGSWDFPGPPVTSGGLWGAVWELS